MLLDGFLLGLDGLFDLWVEVRRPHHRDRHFDIFELRHYELFHRVDLLDRLGLRLGFNNGRRLDDLLGDFRSGSGSGIGSAAAAQAEVRRVPAGVRWKRS